MGFLLTSCKARKTSQQNAFVGGARAGQLSVELNQVRLSLEITKLLDRSPKGLELIKWTAEWEISFFLLNSQMFLRCKHTVPAKLITHAELRSAFFPIGVVHVDAIRQAFCSLRRHRQMLRLLRYFRQMGSKLQARLKRGNGLLSAHLFNTATALWRSTRDADTGFA